MRFALNDEQTGLRDLVRDVLEAESPVRRVQDQWDSSETETAGDQAWEALAGVGVMGVLVPEDHGGLGLDETYVVGLLEETGYAALPGPIVDTVAVGAPLLADADPRGDEPLQAVLEGRARVSVDAGDALIPYGGRSDTVLSLGPAGAGPVELLTGGHSPVPTVDRARSLVRVADPVRTGLPVDPAVAEKAWLRGVLGTSAQLVGLARRMLDLTVEYVTQREQFGAPVGSFQAIKHSLADRHRANAFAAPAVSRAAWSLAHAAPEAQTHVAMAKVLASDAANDMARAAIQSHGAMGYTVEYDLHVYAKRAWALARAWGSAGWHRGVVAETLGLTEPARATDEEVPR